MSRPAQKSQIAEIEEFFQAISMAMSNSFAYIEESAISTEDRMPVVG